LNHKYLIKVRDNLISGAATSEGLARVGVRREELVVANLSAFTELFESNGSSLDKIVTESIDEFGKTGVGRSINGIRGFNDVNQDLTNQVLGFSTAPQVQVGLSDMSVEISSFFKSNIFAEQVQVLRVDLENASQIVFSVSHREHIFSSNGFNSIERNIFKLGASENQSIQSTTIVVQQSKFVISFAVLEDIDIKRADRFVGSSQTTRTGNGNRIRAKNKETVTVSRDKSNLSI
jgi:hypothetical protein